MNDFICNLQRFAKIWMRVGKNRIKLFKLEFKIAKSTIKPLMALIVLFFMSLLSLWVLALLLIGLGAFALTANIPLSVAIVLLVNIAFLMLILQGIRFFLNMASFQKTRHSLRPQNKGANS